jgi:transcriptional regulator with XRE-family HTH domain
MPNDLIRTHECTLATAEAGYRPPTREEVRQREETAWSLRQRGWSQQRIAAELGVSQPAVHKILRRVERRVLARLSHSVASVKARQAGQLEFLLDEAVQAWERSKGKTTRETRRESHRIRETVRETRDSCGDIRFLAEARALLEAERDLWGIGDPRAERERREADEARAKEERKSGRDAIRRALADPVALDLLRRLEERLGETNHEGGEGEPSL